MYVELHWPSPAKPTLLTCGSSGQGPQCCKWQMVVSSLFENEIECMLELECMKLLKDVHVLSLPIFLGVNVSAFFLGGARSLLPSSRAGSQAWGNPCLAGWDHEC